MIELAPNNPHGLALRSPVIAAAGCLGYGTEYSRMLDLAAFGAIVTRTTTLYPRRTAQPPHLIETPAGLLAVGPWPNPGIAHVVNRLAPTWAEWSTPIIVSISGETVQEYGQIAAAVEGVEGIAALELIPPDDLSRSAFAVAAVRRATTLPVVVKMPPLEATPLLALVAQLTEAGADALTLFSAPLGAAHDQASGELREGWLTGPATGPLTFKRLAEIVPQLSLPVIGCGGIASSQDARQMLALGARAVQVGAALLANPHAIAAMAMHLAGVLP